MMAIADLMSVLNKLKDTRKNLEAVKYLGIADDIESLMRRAIDAIESCSTEKLELEYLTTEDN